MEHPSKWLAFAIVVHGLFGSFTEQQTGFPQKFASPLSHFYNSSISSHYGMMLNGDGVTMTMTIVSNVLMGGSILSTLVFLPKMDSWGRKNVAVYVRSGCAMVAGLLMILAKFFNSIELFLAAVFFIGAQKPLRIGVTKMYISECSPDQFRGFSVEAVGTLSFVAALLPTVLAFESVFGNESRWHWVGFTSFLWAVIYLVIASFIPESPKMMVLKQEKPKKVDAVLRKYHGKNVDIDYVLNQYNREFELTQMSNHVSFFDVFKDSALTSSLFLVIVTCLIPSLSPNQIIQVNAIPLKMKFGFSNDAAIKFDFVCNLLTLPFTFVMPFAIEKVGRRFVILFAIFANVVSCLALFTGEWLLSAPESSASVVTLSLGIVFSAADYAAHSAGVSLLFIILIADILPASAKAVTSQFAFLLNNVTSILTTELYSNLHPYLHAYTYLLFGALQLYFIYYIFRYLPETKQRAVYQNYEQVQQYSAASTPFSKFSTASAPFAKFSIFSLGSENVHKFSIVQMPFQKMSIIQEPLVPTAIDKVYGSINI